MDFLKILAFALVAAIGNAMFAIGQKKADVAENTLVFIAMAGCFCIGLTMIAVFIVGSSNYSLAIRQNWHWALLSGSGLFLTYLGFNLLYSRYGASNYIIYAVLSIITTSLVVGVLIFKERFNLYHLGALFSATLTVYLYWLGNR